MGALWQKFVGSPRWIPALVGLIGIYLAELAAILLLYTIVLWPREELLASSGYDNVFITLGKYTVAVNNEIRLLLLVWGVGALGTVARALPALWLHAAANNDFNARWAGWYLTRPILGATMATAFYLLFRGGLVSYEKGGPTPSLYGFLAIAVLVGMFSDEALQKMKDVAQTIFTKTTPLEEMVSGQAAPDGGDYVMVEHVDDGNTCPTKNVVSHFAKKKALAACGACHEPVRWKIVKED